MVCKLARVLVLELCNSIETHMREYHTFSLSHFLLVRLRKIVHEGGWILIRFLLSDCISLLLIQLVQTYVEARARPADNTIVRVRDAPDASCVSSRSVETRVTHCNHVTREKSLGSGDSCLVPLSPASKHSSFRSSPRRRSLFSRAPAAGSL